jgi:hypothetical protein
MCQQTRLQSGEAALLVVPSDDSFERWPITRITNESSEQSVKTLTRFLLLRFLLQHGSQNGHAWF